MICVYGSTIRTRPSFLAQILGSKRNFLTVKADSGIGHVIIIIYSRCEIIIIMIIIMIISK